MARKAATAKAEAKPGDDLNDSQKKFAHAYVDCLNATEAAKKAGYAESTAYSQGHRLKTDPKVRAYIDVLFDALDMGPGQVKSRICDIARGDMGDFLNIQGDEDAEIVSISLYRAKKARQLRLLRKCKSTVKEMGQFGTIRTVEIDLYAADKALYKLADYHGLSRPKVQEPGDDDEETEDEKALESGDLAIENKLETGLGG